MKYTFFDLLTLIGALGFFIYGMKIMSEGIQKVAGSQLRKILGGMTSNRFKGVLTGVLITSLVQSSSATTVMVVSFVNAGLLSLIESIGVIMGANIGTTVTAWLISVFGFSKFSIAAISLPIIAVGFPMIFLRNAKVKSFGEFLIGFALLFMGLSALKDAVPDLKGNPEALEFLAQFTGNGIFTTLFFIFVGTVMTVVVQSSSAAMALTLTLLHKELITFDIAAAMVLGENIGTTITANLAAMIANVHAKRAARAHFMFNIFGVVWIILVFPFFLEFVQWLWGFMQGGVSVADTGKSEFEYQLSLFHTIFNIVNVTLLIGFVGFIAKTVTRLVPSKGDDEEFKLEYISTGLASTPEMSIIQARKELAKFAEYTSRMSSFIQTLIQGTGKGKVEDKLYSKIKEYEDNTDRFELEIATYLGKAAEGNISQKLQDKITGMLGVGSNLERVGDLFYQISLVLSKKKASGQWFSEEQKNGLIEILKLVDEAFEVMQKNLDRGTDEPVSLDIAYEIEKRINTAQGSLRKAHLARILGTGEELKGLIYSDLILLCEKIGDHIINVSEDLVASEEKEHLDDKY